MENIEKSAERLAVLKKIDEYEEKGLWDQDLEDDPPTYVLKPNQIDYMNKKIKNKINAKISHVMAKAFLKKIIKTKQLQIKEVIGIENLQNLETGAVLTCNHFNPFDNFAINYVFLQLNEKHKKLYTVIREGNYTNFPGFYGYLMRHCYTLPLSSDKETMRNFIVSVNKLLKQGNFVLVYPEQSLWWNYKKPKPLKKGAYDFAVSAKVPVVPCFVTMEDSNVIGSDGFPIQEYTIHIEKPIYANNSCSKPENISNMMQKNYDLWKDCYENVYGIKIVYKKASKTA